MKGLRALDSVVLFCSVLFILGMIDTEQLKFSKQTYGTALLTYALIRDALIAVQSSELMPGYQEMFCLPSYS